MIQTKKTFPPLDGTISTTGFVASEFFKNFFALCKLQKQMSE